MKQYDTIDRSEVAFTLRIYSNLSGDFVLMSVETSAISHK